MAEAEIKVRLEADDKASDKIKGVGGSLDKLSGGAGKALNVIKGFGVAFAGVATAVGAFAVASVNKFSEVGDAVEKMSIRTGFAAESISALRVAADASGTSIDSVEMAIKTMSRTMGDAFRNADIAKESFRGLGISVQDIEMLEPEQMFVELGNAIAKIEDPILRMDKAAQLFGKSGTDLLPLFEDGAFSMEEWSKKAKELGVSFNDLAAANAAKLNDALGELKAAFSGVALTVGSELAPKFVEIVEKMKPFIAQAAKFLAENLPVWIDIAVSAFGRLWDFVQRVRQIFNDVVAAIQGFINKIAEFGVIEAVWDALSTSAQNVAKVFRESLWPALQNVFAALEPYIPTLTAVAQLIGITLLGALLAVIKILEVALIVFAKVAAFLSNALAGALEVAIKGWDKLTQTLDKVVGYFRSVWEWADKAAKAAAGVVSGGIGKVGKVLGFAEGGIVPGPIGAPVPAIVHGGERIIPNGGGGGAGISMVFQSPVFLDALAADKFSEMVMQRLKNGTRV